MIPPPTSSEGGDPGEVTRIAEEFIRLHEAGELSDLEEFCGRYPEPQRARVRDQCEQLLRIRGVIQRPDRLGPGQQLGPFRILEQLGTGGMGEVYRAEDTRLARQVALKVLPEGYASSTEHMSRFKREAKTLAALSHPNIVTIFSVEEAKGIPFLTMELVAGRTLAELLPPDGLPLDRFLSLAIPVADALASAHGRGIVHRDLKPANVMVADEGDRVKVLDFGLAKVSADAVLDRTSTVTLTEPGRVLGTPHYMSPEQTRGAHLDHRSDVFSFGVLLFEMATGIRPFRGSTAIELMSSILKDTPPPVREIKPGLPRHLGRVIGRCLAKEPEDRYQTARDVFNELKELRQELETSRSTQPRRPVPESSLALGVLPMEVTGTDDELEALGRGLTEDLVAGLSAFSYLSVIEVERRPDSGDVGHGARYLLSGSLRRYGERVRLSARVIDAVQSATVWSERFDRHLGDQDLFELQDQLTDRIVATVADSAGVLVREMAAQLRSRPEEELTGTDWILRTFGHWEQMRPADHARMRDGLEEAVKREPDDSAIWSCLAQTYLDEHRVGFNVRPGALDRALAAARRAVELDPRNSLAEESLADVQFFRRDMTAFRLAADRALSLNPRDATTLASMGMWLVLSGEFDRGFEINRRAAELHPHHPGWYQFAPFFYHYQRAEYRQALDAAKKMDMPDFFWNWLMVAAASGQIGLDTEARGAVARLQELLEEPGPDALREAEKFIVPDELRERFYEGLRRAGLAVPHPDGGATASPATRTRRPLVGRDAERAALLGKLEGAASGRGALVLLAGEPGVGKTRIASEILEDGRERGMLALAGRARENETEPFVLATELLGEMVRLLPKSELRTMLGDDAAELSRLMPELRRTFADVPEPIDVPPERQRRVLLRSITEILERAAMANPLVVLLDDIHWADESSLLLLEHLASRLVELPILVLATYRDVEADMEQPFERTMANLVRQRLAERIQVGRFQRQSVLELLEVLGGEGPPPELVDAIHRNTEGNAFFIEEVFRHLSEEGLLFGADGKWGSSLDVGAFDVPEGVRLVVGRRLERLERAQRAGLSTAAVIGLRFDLRLLESAIRDADRALDAVEAAEAVQLIRPVAGDREVRYEFNHALARQTVLDGLSLPRLQRAHLAVADAFEEVYGSSAEEQIAAIAHHLYRAGTAAPAGRTCSALRLAGDRALASGAPDAATESYDRALSLVDDPEGTERGEILSQRGAASLALGKWNDAAAAWQEALPILESGGRTDLVAWIYRHLANQELWANRPAAARELVEKGLEVVGEGASPARCRLLAMLGHGHSLGGGFDEAERLNMEAAAMARGLGDEQLERSVLLAFIRMYLHSYRPGKMVAAAERAIEIARRSGRPWYLSTALGSVFFGWLGQGRFSTIDDKLDEALKLAGHEGDLGSLLQLNLTQSLTSLARGRLPEAREAAQRAIDVSRAASFPWTGAAQGFLAMAEFFSGRWDAARSAVTEAMSRPLEGTWRGVDAGGWIRILVYTDPDTADKMLVEWWERLPHAGALNTLGSWTLLGGCVEAAALLGRGEAADLHAALCQLLAEDGRVLWQSGLTEKLAGIAASAGRRWDVAEAHFDAAHREAEEMPHLLERPEVRRWHARMLLDRRADGDLERARGMLTEARREYTGLGMPKHAAMVDQMRECGSPPTRRPALVGRDAERSDLESRLEAARSGHGTLVLLGGEPGVGKTRLATEILELGRERGMLALTGFAREQEETPFLTVIELLEDLVRQVPAPDLQPCLEGSASELTRLLPELRRLIPGMPEPIDAPPEHQKRLLFKSVIELLARAGHQRPLVVLLDDLHWADESSLQLIEHLASRLRDLPILAIGTYRDVETEMSRAFSGSLATLTRQRLAERVAVKPFTESSAAELLAALGGSEPPREVASAIQRDTEGNAFFIEEVFRHLSEEGVLFDDRGQWRSDFDAERPAVPEGVRLVIGHRLERLRESTQRTLTTAAVFGLRFGLSVLKAALAETVPVLEALEEAEAAQLIRSIAAGRGSDYEFSHALVRETLLSGLSQPRRQQLHAGAAEAFERVLGDRALERAPEIAMHMSRAGECVDPARTVHYLIAAGDRSLDEAAADEALRYFDTALGHVEATTPADAGTRARILHGRARAQRARGEWPAAATDLEAALEMFDSLGDGERVARICCELGDVLFFANRLSEASALAERGLDVMPEEPSIERCRLLARQGCYLTLLGDFARGDPILGEAEAMADSLSDPEIRAAVARFRLAQQHRLMNGTAKLRAALEAVELAKTAGSIWELSQSQGLALVAVVYAGRFDLLSRIEETERLAEELGDASALMCAQVARTVEHLIHGRVAAAVEQGVPMLASMDRLGGYWHHGHAHLATAHYYAGNWEEAREHSATAARDEPRDGWFGWCAAGHVKLLAFLGERDEALEMIDAHAAEVPEVGSPAPIGRWAWALAAPEALATLGLADRAAAFHPLVVDVIERGTRWAYDFGLTEKVAGITAACAGRWERAEEHFASALRQARELPCRVEEPEVLRWQAWAARCRDHDGDRERARTLLAEARDVAHGLGMKGHVELLERMPLSH